MIKHQTAQKSEKEIASRWGRYNLPFALCTNSTKRALVKDLYFIGPKLSHLIKLTVAKWATQVHQGHQEIGWCQTYVTLNAPFSLGGKEKKDVIASKASNL